MRRGREGRSRVVFYVYCCLIFYSLHVLYLLSPPSICSSRFLSFIPSLCVLLCTFAPVSSLSSAFPLFYFLRFFMLHPPFCSHSPLLSFSTVFRCFTPFFVLYTFSLLFVSLFLVAYFFHTIPPASVFFFLVILLFLLLFCLCPLSLRARFLLFYSTYSLSFFLPCSPLLRSRLLLLLY